MTNQMADRATQQQIDQPTADGTEPTNWLMLNEHDTNAICVLRLSRENYGPNRQRI